MKNLLACALVLGACFPVMADNLCPQYLVADYGTYKYYFATRCPGPGGAYWVGPAIAVPTGPCGNEADCYGAYLKRDKSDQPSPKYGASDDARKKGAKKGSEIEPKLGIIKEAKGGGVAVLAQVREPFIAELKKMGGGDAGLIKVYVLVLVPLNGEGAVFGLLAHEVKEGKPVATAKQFHGKDKEWHFEVDVPGTLLAKQEGQILREED